MWGGVKRWMRMAAPLRSLALHAVPLSNRTGMHHVAMKVRIRMAAVHCQTAYDLVMTMPWGSNGGTVMTVSDPYRTANIS